MSDDTKTNVESQEQQQQQQSNQIDENGDDALESLVRTLHNQIKSSNWLDVNNASKFEQENPELMKAWNEEVEKFNQQQHEHK
jgi:hypothetical protein